MTYNLFDVGAEVIARKYHANAPAIRRVLITLDPIDPKRAYSKLSKILLTLNNGRDKWS